MENDIYEYVKRLMKGKQIETNADIYTTMMVIHLGTGHANHADLMDTGLHRVNWL